MITFVALVAFWIRARRANFPPRAARLNNAMLHTGVLQVVLGVSTLLMSVPTFLAAAHQATALLLLSVMLLLAHSLRKVPI